MEQEQETKYNVIPFKKHLSEKYNNKQVDYARANNIKHRQQIKTLLDETDGKPNFLIINGDLYRLAKMGIN